MLALLSCASRALAAWPDGRELDREDLVVATSHRAGSSDVRGRSWISLVAFERVFTSQRDVGMIAVVGLALDRIATGPVHAISERPAVLPAPDPPKDRGPPAEGHLPLDPALARATVAAAWRAAGLGVDDARIDAIVARARLSAALPETRLRAMRLVDQRDRVDTTAASGDARYYDYAGANLWLEARLTWRLDRLLYADDEPTLERVRLERFEARARVAAKIIDTLFLWQRALLDVRDAPPGTREDADARLRAIETEVALDVLTGGWFGRARKAPPAEPPTKAAKAQKAPKAATADDYY